MIEGAKKMPEPMTLPTMRSVASRRESPRTSSTGRGFSPIPTPPHPPYPQSRGGYHVDRMLYPRAILGVAGPAGG